MQNGQSAAVTDMATTAAGVAQKVQSSFDFESNDTFKLPPLKLLKTPSKTKAGAAQDELDQNAEQLKQVLSDFRIQGEVDDVRDGPVVTRYGLNPAPGTKSQRVIALADDIARSMSALAVRVAVVPGQNVIGIELPNKDRETVLLRHIFDDPDWLAEQGNLPLALGKDIAGSPVIADLARMPHLLVAGTTGSGKSVGINGMILSLLYRYTPDECRLIMIDPKMLELSVYDGIPHLLTPVVTDPSKAIMALKWAVREMESRYRNMAKMGVRNIDGYNERLAEARSKGEVMTRRVQTGFDLETGRPVFEEDVFDMDPLPFIVVVIDEVADLMMVAGKEIEAAVQRLAQMARAAGIHVIMATQRPSVDVITGTIKANFPTRISFQVTSRIDSRTILGEQGAEQLLGRGDMLFMEGGGRVVRVHGPFVDDREVEDVANFLRQQGEPDYNESVTKEDESSLVDQSLAGASSLQPATGNSLYDEAVALVVREQKASTSFVQRHLKIGYNRAATLVEEMESAGIISSANHVGKREVLIQNEDI
ncbi:MAG: cell division protein FtsK [Rhodospirillaceae bacterium]|nr:cell division protein FtsK [Rhodospirillaceae bacterium]